jgi:polyisoprenoid-binding protein YceI
MKMQELSWFGMSLLVSLGLSSIAQSTSAPKKFKVDSSKSPVTFDAVGKPGFLRIKGTGAKLSGEAVVEKETLSGVFTVALQPLTTDNSMRDGHMHEKYLDSKKFPEATLTVTNVKIGDGSTKYSGDFTGMLKIKDNSKEVSGKINLSFAGMAASGDATFEISIEDYPSIGVPSWLGVTVAKTVTLGVKIEATEEAASPVVANKEEVKKDSKSAH